MGLNKFPQFPLRIDPALINKMRYIGYKNSRSTNKEIEQLIIKRIEDWEDENGEITDKDIERLL